MTEAEWLDCSRPREMLQFIWVRQKGSATARFAGLFHRSGRDVKPVDDRKIRYVLRACSRRYCQFFSDERAKRALDQTDRYVEGLASREELEEASRQTVFDEINRGYPNTRRRSQQEVYEATRALRQAEASGAARELRVAGNVAQACLNPRSGQLLGSLPVDAIAGLVDLACAILVPNGFFTSKWEKTRAAEEKAIAGFVRDVVGNPFHPVTLDPRWQTATAVDLARAIYDVPAFDRMPILADALMDAGCDNEDILSHCRQDGEHVRGCWVVDLLTGRK